MRSAPVFFVIAVTGALSGCPEDPDDAPADAAADGAACDLAVSLGTGGHGDRFVPLADDDVAEVIVGYQGFIFIQTILKIEAIPAGQVLAPFTIHLEGHDPYGDNKRVDLTDGGDGAVYSAPLSLYFNDFPLPDVVGKRCQVAVTVDRQGCTGHFSADLDLRNDDPCIHFVDDPEQTGCYDADGGVPDGDGGVELDAAVDAGDAGGAR